MVLFCRIILCYLTNLNSFLISLLLLLLIGRNRKEYKSPSAQHNDQYDLQENTKISDQARYETSKGGPKKKNGGRRH
jgi:hypothetical protein